MALRIDGLDKLQRHLKEAEKAFTELDGEIAVLRFDPTDFTSVETAIADMEVALDDKAAPYLRNPFVEPLIQQLKAAYRSRILEEADKARVSQAISGGVMVVDQQTFRAIENTVNDLRRADYRSFSRHIKKLSRLLHSDALDQISNDLKSRVDLDQWLDAGEGKRGAMAGSSALVWPEDHEQELGLVIALTDAFADETQKPEVFAHIFYYTGSKITAELQHMASEIYVPFARDYIDYVKSKKGVEEGTLMPIPNLDPASRRIFVVHGHDEGPREAVARFLEQLDFEPIILHEQASRGRTIIEKIEAHSDVGFAVVLLTPDDVGGVRDGQLRTRARQNVLLELGYFVGRLGRSRVVALKKGEIEIPSDFGGVVYEAYDSGNGWKQALGRELQAAGFEVDWNSIMRRG